jgi:hypothetical protein|nr:MAG TPA: hypothetical protein [Caudoviricetes sp.]
MVVLVDKNKAVEISIREWDEENSQYGPDWAADFFEVGNLKHVENEELELAYVVDDVDYCIEQANDMVAGEGDFAGEPQPSQFVDVTELDRSAYPICKIDLRQLSSDIYDYGVNVKDTEMVSDMRPNDTIKVDFTDGTTCYVGIDLDFPLCVDFVHYADESGRPDVALSEDAHDFEGESDYLAGVKDICGGLR